MTRGQRGTQERALQSQRAIREITGHFCAHLPSWKLATPRWKKPTAMQASLVTAWSNAWGQKCPWNTQVCNPVTPVSQMRSRRMPSNGSRNRVGPHHGHLQEKVSRAHPGGL